MWFERFVIVITSLAQDFLPSSWGYFKPTWVDILTLAGSFGLFMTLFLLFIRFLPVIAIAEVKHVMPEANPHGPRHDEARIRRQGGVRMSAAGATGNERRRGRAATQALRPAGRVRDAGGDLRGGRAVREAGYRWWDCHTPFPVHGLDKAMGIKPTILPWLVSWRAGSAGPPSASCCSGSPTPRKLRRVGAGVGPRLRLPGRRQADPQRPGVPGGHVRADRAHGRRAAAWPC